MASFFEPALAFRCVVTTQMTWLVSLSSKQILSMPWLPPSACKLVYVWPAQPVITDNAAHARDMSPTLLCIENETSRLLFILTTQHQVGKLTGQEEHCIKLGLSHLEALSKQQNDWSGRKAHNHHKVHHIAQLANRACRNKRHSIHAFST